jgi:hypothetical protein
MEHAYCYPYEIKGNNYGKLYHLEFLLQLSKKENVKGIIGNTTDCLDLAAFIGYNVVNFHQIVYFNPSYFQFSKN